MEKFLAYIDASIERYRYLVSGAALIFALLFVMVRFGKGVPLVFEILCVVSVLLSGFSLLCGAFIIGRLYAVKVYVLELAAVKESSAVADDRDRDRLAGKVLGFGRSKKIVEVIYRHVFGLRKCDRPIREMTMFDLECELEGCEARLVLSLVIGVLCFAVYSMVYVLVLLFS